MERGPTGTIERGPSFDGESVRAFVPFPLPPSPPLLLEGDLREQLDRGLLELGRLDSVALLLPDTRLFLYAYIRREAVLSSQIEGTRSTLSDLLLFEINEAPGVPMDDVAEVSNYVAALEHGLSRLRDGFPLSNRLLCETHEKLLARGRGAEKHPGVFRTSQNWIQGARPGVALYVPPPADRVSECMSELEKFIHSPPGSISTLLKAALAHVQFESIHPYLDGNGRLGRLLITLLFCNERVLQEPLLYLSLYFKKHRDEYYDLLQRVRTAGDWEAWIAFFVAGVTETAGQAVETAKRLARMFRADRERVANFGRIAGSALRVHEALERQPILSVGLAAKKARLSTPTTTSALNALMESGIARELTGKRRNRLFGYQRYLAILNEGTEPLPLEE